MVGAKLAAARAAVLAFVGAMRLPDDQVALVTFSETARVLVPLTGNRESVDRALDAIAPTPGTRLDRGLRLGIEELRSPRHRAENLRVILVLSDGLQGETAAAAREAASTARGEGVVICTIGLGGDADEALLIDVAGGRVRYRFAPSADEVAALYSAALGTASRP